MSPRAAELVRLLGLAPHPEGGAYKETWRAPSGSGVRAAVTTIYFLLDRDERSRWHRVDADEIWTHLEGGPLELWTWAEGRAPERRVLGPVDQTGARPVAVVPGGLLAGGPPCCRLRAERMHGRAGLRLQRLCAARGPAGNSGPAPTTRSRSSRRPAMMATRPRGG